MSLLKPETQNSKLILHIDADAFFASVEQGFTPSLRNKPVIVGGTADQRGVVHTASYEARKLGVHTGMPLGQAKRLVPHATFLKGNFEHESHHAEDIKKEGVTHLFDILNKMHFFFKSRKKSRFFRKFSDFKILKIVYLLGKKRFFDLNFV